MRALPTFRSAVSGETSAPPEARGPDAPGRSPREDGLGRALRGAHLLGVAALALLALVSSAAAETIETGSTVRAATVYPQGATVAREAAFAAPPGRHSIVLQDLPVEIDEDSLRVEGVATGAGFVIQGLNYRVDRPRPEPLGDPERERLEEEIRAVEFELREQEDAAARAAGRRAYAEAMREATVAGPFWGGRGAESGDPAAQPPRLIDRVEDWRQAWELFADEIASAQRAEREADRRVAALERALDALARQLDQTTPPPPRGVLTVSIDAPEAVEDGLLTVRYLTRQASWSPLYDLRLSAGDFGGGSAAAEGEDAAPTAAPGRSTLTVVRRAAVRQATGEDWIGAELTLSTARPTARLEAQEPQIAQARLAPPPPPQDALAEPQADRERAAKSESAPTAGVLSRRLNPPAEATAALSAAAPRRAADETSALAAYDGAAAIYRIPDPVDVPGDGEVRQARIGAFDALVETEARATPARDPNAYLYVIFPNADQPLPPGRASIYRGDAYLGQITLPAIAPGEIKPIGFGRYEALKIERRIRDRSEGQEGVFATSNRRQSRFEITLRNLSDAPVTVRLFDSLPFTEDERIQIALTSAPKPTAQDVDGRRGALEWVLTAPPRDSKTVAFSYVLSWPEGETLLLNPQ